MTLRKIAVIGAGGFGLEAAMLIEQINLDSLQWDMIGYFDDYKNIDDYINGYPLIGKIFDINTWEEPLCVVAAIANPELKKQIIQSISNKNISYPKLIHPTVITGNEKYVSIGEGCIICANNIIKTNISIGRHVIIGLGCMIGHESSIGNFSSLMPYCNISGGVVIHECTYWGTGSKIINDKKVGENAIICAGAVVVRDVPSGVTAVGVPAKIIGSPKDNKVKSEDTGLRKDSSPYIKLIEEIIEAEPGTITISDELEEIHGWDSMALLGLIAIVDERYEEMIDLEKLAKCISVNDIVSLLDNLINGG